MIAFCPYDGCDEQIDVEVEMNNQTVTCPRCLRDARVEVCVDLTPIDDEA